MDVPFEKIVELIKPDRDLSRNPIFQVTLDILNIPTYTNNINIDQNLNIEYESVSKFDLTFYL